MAMMAGITLAAAFASVTGGVALAVAVVAVMAAWVAVRGRIGGRHLGQWHFAVVMLAWGSAGMAAAWWQLGKAAPAIDRGLSVELAGMVTAVDGRLDDRLRVWLAVSHASKGEDRLRHHLVRLSVRPRELIPLVGSHVSLSARIYPPPPPVLYGARDHGVQARIRGVVASGYVTAVHSVTPPDLAAAPFPIRLGALRQARADRIAAGMTDPAGGIAAALLIGDRRYVSTATYEMFRQSGLAHLLAISGLHMGLLCFGVIGFLRAVMALWPVPASRVPVHKYAALAGIAVGLAYLLLSGLSVSAIRAFLMAMLILAAWLADRLGLTLRNVGLAAGVILLVNPYALFSAGFQLSFAATTALVIWFETWRHRAVRQDGGGAGRPLSRPLRWAGDLVLASCLASAATLPLTAQHFGTITPWGVLANLAGIPLTGLWIMPAGLFVLATQFLPVPSWMAGAALWVMQAGIDWLVVVAGLFADLPAAPFQVPPPGAAVLVLAGILMATAFCLVLPLRLKTACWIGAAGMVIGGIALPARDDAVLLARGAPQLILAGATGEAAIHASAPRAGGRLSGFLADSAARQLAQPVMPAADGAKGADVWFAGHWLRDGRRVTVVMLRRGLSAGCRVPADMVLALVEADYPCRSGVPLVSLAGLPRGNYRLTIGEQGVTARATDGQYLRISPVSRP